MRAEQRPAHETRRVAIAGSVPDGGDAGRELLQVNFGAEREADEVEPFGRDQQRAS